MPKEVIEATINLTENAIQSGYSSAVIALVSKVIPKMVEGSYQFIKDKYNDKKKEYEESYIEYLNSVLNDIGYIKTLHNRHNPSLLEEVFVETKLKTKNKEYMSNCIKDLLRITPPFVQINGAGGMGKTTILKFLFIQVLKQKEFIPIFVELKKVREIMTENELLQFIYDSMSRYNFKVEKNIFVSTLDTGKYVFFIDGFDEIRPEFQQSVYSALNDIKTKYNKNHYFVSSRNTELMKNGWRTSTILDVQPLEKKQSIAMLEKVTNFDEETLNRFKKSVTQEEFYDKYHEFISNPLLLSLMLLTFNQFAELPEKLHLFYDKAFSSLYSEHDATKENFVRVKRMEKDNVTYDEFIKILDFFSLISYSEKKSSFASKKEIFETFDLVKTNTRLKKFDNENLLIDLCDNICLLVNDNNEYRFLHRSFQEYFAGCYIEILTDGEQEKVLNHLYDIDKEMFYSDEFFSMLYDKNTTRMKQNFVTPKLSAYLKQFDGLLSDDEIWNYLLNGKFEIESNKFLSGVLELGFKFLSKRKLIKANETSKIKRPIEKRDIIETINLDFVYEKIINLNNQMIEKRVEDSEEILVELGFNLINKVYRIHKEDNNFDEMLRDIIRNQKWFELSKRDLCFEVAKFNLLKEFHEALSMANNGNKNGSIAELFQYS